MIYMPLTPVDTAVLAYLAEHGNPVVLKDVARDLGIAKVTLEVSLQVLGAEGLVCFFEGAEPWGRSTIIVSHLHPDHGDH